MNSEVIGGIFGFMSSFSLNSLRFSPMLPSSMIPSIIILGLSDLGQRLEPVVNYMILLKLICIMVVSHVWRIRVKMERARRTLPWV